MDDNLEPFEISTWNKFTKKINYIRTDFNNIDEFKNKAYVNLFNHKIILKGIVD